MGATSTVATIVGKEDHSDNRFTTDWFLKLIISVKKAKKLGFQLKIKLTRLKEGAIQLLLLEEVPFVLYRVIDGKKSSWWSLLFQLVNFTGSWCLATTLNNMLIVKV